jgi:hypothetical protein
MKPRHRIPPCPVPVRAPAVRRLADAVRACAALCALALAAGGEAAAPAGLLCDLLRDPEHAAVAGPAPHLGWTMVASAPGQRQSAYRIIASSRSELLGQDQGDLWDSGRVASPASLDIPYHGSPLPPGGSWLWKVRTWDGAGAASAWSTAQRVTMAASPPAEWPRQALVTIAQPPQSLVRAADGTVFADFGRDAFGYAELILDQAQLRALTDAPGGRIGVTFGERAVNGHVDGKPGGSVRAAHLDIAVPAGPGRYALHPPADKRNTGGPAVRLPLDIGTVVPFRYLELSGLAAAPAQGTLLRMAVRYPVDDDAAAFSSSSPELDAVWDLCRYSIAATTFCGLYVDGDRERTPYEADAYIDQLGHYCIDREFALARATHEYLLAHPTWPTEWKQFSILIAHADWWYTGDTRCLAAHYDELKAGKLLLEHERSDGLLDTATLRDLVDWPATERDGCELKPVNTVVNAFHYRTLVAMAEIADALGRSADAADFTARAQRCRAAIAAKLIDPASGIFRDGEGSLHSSLHANAFPLAFGAVPDAHRAAVAAFVRAKGMACSPYAAQFLLEGLYADDTPADDAAALALLTAGGQRSWRHMLDLGSTITLEAWDPHLKPNLDWNHAWGAAPANLIPRFVLGVRPLRPGWSTALVQPRLGGLARVCGTVPTIRGAITVVASRDQDGVAIDLTLPVGVSAQVALPAIAGAVVSCDGTPCQVQRSGRWLVVEGVDAGRHHLAER